MSMFLLAMPVAQLVYYQVRVTNLQSPEAPERQAVQVVSDVQEPTKSQLRDVYYIILDAYGRSDILSNTLGYDNSDFLSKLEGMGFYVAECAQSNYAKTDLSLSSSLNIDP